MKSDRLLALLLLLQTRGRACARDLATELEVSERTIYRDMEALGAAGVPVYAERGRHGGCCLLDGYRTDVSGLTADEARALFVFAGRGTMAGLGLEGDLHAALRKLLAALPARQRPGAEQARDRVVVDSLGWRRQPDEVPWLGVIQQAVWSDRRLRLRYRSADASEAGERHVDPYGLVVKAGVWYLVAATGGDARMYRVSRVEKATLIDEPSHRPPGLDVEALWDRLRQRAERSSSDAVVVTVRARGAVTDRLLRMSAPSLTGPAERQPDPERPGWNLLRLPWVAAGAAQALLLGMGSSVEVVTPDSLRTSLAMEAARVVALYADTTQ